MTRRSLHSTAETTIKKSFIIDFGHERPSFETDQQQRQS